MTLTTLDEYITANNLTGVDGILEYTAYINPFLFPSILFAFYLVVLIGSYMGMKRLNGYSDMSISFTIAGVTTFSLALVMTLSNILDYFSFALTFFAMVGGVVMLFLNKGRNEY